MTEVSPDWVAVDWGTTRLRAWVMRGTDNIQARLTSECGMGGLAPDMFERALVDLIGPYLREGHTLPVICCGAVGARQGWQEAPYAKVPCPPPGLSDALVIRADDPRIAPRILPGIMQADPADVMRGEETQIAGFLAANPNFDGVICLPGTHTKWVQISANEVISFRTFMTGELFSLLSGHSVLRHGMASEGWDDTSFAAAVADAMSSPQQVSSRLFGIRAETLLNGLGPEAARARLSGLLLGAELAGAKSYWLGQRLALIGDETLCAHYERALALQGVASERPDAEGLTLAGLVVAYRQGKEGPR